MGNAPLCISQQAVMGEYVDNQDDYMLLAQSHAMRYRSVSPADRLTCSLREEGIREKGVGVWWSEDQWEEEERDCDMVLGLELFQDSVSCNFKDIHARGCTDSEID